MDNGVKNRISFDFDSTLDRPDVQKFANHLINQGLEVWITTSRSNNVKNMEHFQFPDWHKDLWDVAKSLGIPQDRVKFTNMVDKYTVLTGQGFIFHLDDDSIEIELAFENRCDCEFISVKDPKWQSICEGFLSMNSYKNS